MDGFHHGQIAGVWFDLDGTLLEVEMRRFIPAYTRGLAGAFADLTEPESFAELLLAATLELLRREDGACSNETFFLERVTAPLGIDGEDFKARLAAYCDAELAALAPLVRPHPLARAALEHCRRAGLRVVLATNPVFPRAVIEARMAWGGFADYPFELVTTYENSRYCKPHRGYFTDILDHMGLEPARCLMIGNDTEHDLAARSAGVPTFLAETWLIDRGAGAFNADYRGDLAELCRLVDRLSGSGDH